MLSSKCVQPPCDTAIQKDGELGDALAIEIYSLLIMGKLSETSKKKKERTKSYLEKMHSLS